MLQAPALFRTANGAEVVRMARTKTFSGAKERAYTVPHRDLRRESHFSGAKRTVGTT